MGDWLVEPSLNRVSRDGVPLHLRPQLIDLLVFLTDRPGRVVSKQEILDGVWPGQVVSESALTACVTELRHAIGDTGPHPRLIENFAKRGYRLNLPSDEPVKSASASASGKEGRTRRWSLAGILALGLVTLAAAEWRLASHDRSESGRAALQSIAVLPFANLTGDPAQEYFVDGITEALASELGHSSPFEVVSGITASRDKNAQKSTREIARDLGGLDGLLEGSVMRSGDRVRVRVHLVDAYTDRWLWTETFDRSVGDILGLYADIAAAVTDQMASPARAAARHAGHRVNAAAYDRFLQGVYFRHGWMGGGCLKAEPLLRDAIALDPDFAEAYAELAFCYVFPDRVLRPGWETAPLAREAITRALSLDDSLAPAYVMLAAEKRTYEFDREGAIRAVRRALDLNPSVPEAHVLYGETLYGSGAYNAGLDQIREGLRLDPMSLDNLTALGFALRNTRHFDEAVAQFRSVLAREPAWATARFWMAESYADAGRDDEAAAEYLAFLRSALVPARVRAVTDLLERRRRQSGMQAFWRAELAVAEEEAARPGTVWARPWLRYCGPYYMARRYARLHDSERALASLEQAFTYRHHLMAMLDVEPLFDALQPDPRFQDLRRRVGLAH